jgi:hypothetical protein
MRPAWEARFTSAWWGLFDMSSFPGSPRLIKGGIVLIDPDSSAVLRVITLQYNPDTLTRTLQIQAVTAEGDRSDPLRLKGPPIETIKVDAELDATDQLEFPDQNSTTTQNGIQAQLAALETIIYPSSSQLISANNLAKSGTLEIAAMEAPLSLFVWSRNRVIPVRITDFSITEEAFDPSLNPIRAKVSLGMRVLNVNDTGFEHRAGSIYMAYQQQKERLAGLSPSGSMRSLGFERLP